MLRRTFLIISNTLLQAAMACVVAIPGVRFLLYPLRRSPRGLEFLRVAELAAITPGAPLRAVVDMDRRDAYLHYPPGPVGSVWLIRGESTEGEASIRCLQTVCPHLGCGIDWSALRQAFVCPCHASEFAAGGEVVSGPSPRRMDELECRIGGPDADGRRWVEVRYEEFRIGAVDKKALT